MRRVQAFTLIEVVLAIFILTLLLVLAVPSLTGVLSDRRLRRSVDTFNNLVNQAHEHSVTEHRSYLVVVGPKAVEVRPEVVTKDDDTAPIAELPLTEGTGISMKLPAALAKDPPPEWIFWPSGTCEPAVIAFANRDGNWEASYSGLTTRPELTRYVPR